MYDIGIHCGYLLPMHNGSVEILQQQFLGIAQGKIQKIKPWESTDKANATKFINASNQLVMPGFINGHTHISMNLLRGLAEDQPFWQWLHETILPIEDQFIDTNFVRIGAELAMLELIHSGVTTFCDMYYLEDVVAEAVDKIGMRAVLGVALADRSHKDTNHFSNWQNVLHRMQTYAGHHRITPCLAPHAPYSCSNETLRAVSEYAQNYNLAIKIHVAESKEEINQSLAQYGLTPVQRLYKLGLMDNQTIFAHCVHVDEKDMELIRQTKTSVIYNPKSNMKLSAGIAPIGEMHKHGVIVGIGTDSAASNNSLNIINELATGIKLQKVKDADNVLTVKDMLAMATINGAKALGLANRVGSLAVGKDADCIILNINHPHWYPRYDIAANLVYAAHGSEVETTICHGKVLMEKRIVQTIDTERLFAEADQLTAKIQGYARTRPSNMCI